MTPYQSGLAMQAMQDRQVTLAWQIAALSRQQKLQPLDKLLCKKKGNNMQSLKSALTGFKR